MGLTRKSSLSRYLPLVHISIYISPDRGDLDAPVEVHLRNFSLPKKCYKREGHSPPNRNQENRVGAAAKLVLYSFPLQKPSFTANSCTPIQAVGVEFTSNFTPPPASMSSDQMATDEVVLLDYRPSPFGTRARIALAEKGISYEHKTESDLANKSCLLMEMNPIYQKIPVLIHNGKSICESDIIVQYIDEVWKHGSPLLPSDPYHRAKARFLVDFIDKMVHRSSIKVWMGKEEDQDIGKRELIEWSKFLEIELGDKSYFGGETFGFVDIAFLPFYNWLDFFKTFANFSIDQECPKLVTWAKRCLERESVSIALPSAEEIYQAYLEFKKRF